MIQYIPAMIQGAVGLAQGIKGLTMDNPDLPGYEKSKAVASFLGTARNELGGLSPQAKEAFAQVRQAGANTSGQAMRASSSGGQALKAAMGINASVASGITGVAMQEAGSRNQRMNMLATATNMQQSEDRYDHQIDYGIASEARARRDAMIGAGMQNLSGAVSSAGTMFMAGKQNDLLKEIYGGGKQTTETVVETTNAANSVAKGVGAVGGAVSAANQVANVAKNAKSPSAISTGRDQFLTSPPATQGPAMGERAMPPAMASGLNPAVSQSYYGSQAAQINTPNLASNPNQAPAPNYGGGAPTQYTAPYEAAPINTTTPYASPNALATYVSKAGANYDPSLVPAMKTTPTVNTPAASQGAAGNIKSQAGIDALMQFLNAQNLMSNPAFINALKATKTF